MSRIDCRVSQNAFRRGQRLMIIELGKYNEANELLIGTETYGHWDIVKS